ncbi:UDP-N-acetylglucosamine transferase subunit [Coemansia sp. RSA 2599]|nr:UDP-N-acetylglucosamine transferase subunit [Coemansia sp. RSA 2598]KAJ1813373.1 UDP-N-acetylglucosamine transferase subunit [Coemansia sp. RSA 2599]
MARLLQGVDFDRYNQRLYIVGESDMLSLDRIGALEAKRDHMAEEYTVSRIPRSREVGQSWSSAVFSSLSCLFSVCQTVFQHNPDVVLCNGPGNCVIVCAVALIPRFFGLKCIPIVYVESFARVRSLSLSGKLLYYMADRFVVQWPGLLQKYPSAEFIPHLV